MWWASKKPEHTGRELKGTHSLNLHMALVCFPLHDFALICSVSPNLISFPPKSHPVYTGKKRPPSPFRVNMQNMAVIPALAQLPLK